MANDVYLSLGAYRFGLETAAYEEIRRQWSWRWAQQDVLNARPFQQYLGPGRVEMRIDGYVTPHFKGGLRQVDAMVAEADRGEALQAVDSLGYVYGDFVITQVTETRREIGPAGLPLRIDFSLALLSTEVDRDTSAPAAPAGGPAPAASAPPFQFNV